ncbi:hypothetical protein BD770DRAFT_472486 [Pilaira anomala]|nr:hypothetical protein BD770DRAFT_472486 [Pilaira anomala]
MVEKMILGHEEGNKNTVKDTSQVSSTAKGPELDVDTVFSSLHKIQKQISNITLSDNNFKSAVERVRRKQANKILALNRILFKEEGESFDAQLEASISQETIDMFLEEAGVKADIEAKKIEANNTIVTLQKLLEKAEHDIAVLTNEIESLKTEVKTIKAENSTLQKHLSVQEETTWKFYDELQALNTIFYGTREITNAFKRCTKHLGLTRNNKN